MKIIKCPICSGVSDTYLFSKDHNRKISSLGFEYRICIVCDTVFLSNRPRNLDRYYADDYYEIPKKCKFEKIANKNLSKIQIILKYKKSGDLLEIGSAFGVFALQAKRSGFNVKTIEMNEKCCKFLREVIGVENIRSSNPTLELQSLALNDIVVAWHVVEHLNDPLEFIKSAAKNLNKGGILVLATPNPKSFQFRIMGKYWPHLDAPRHLFLLPKEVVVSIAERYGLTFVGVEINDTEGLMWNAFGWQRLLMNQFNNRFLKILCFYIGYVLSYAMYPIERLNFNGSCYTIILRKNIK
jgi:2-polyprenyl-3-methyl-5-hydroxy-6-metoxy-1,4-benzoquinol methylase